MYAVGIWVLLFFISPSVTDVTDDWKLVKEKTNLKVYTKKSETEDFNEIRIIGKVRCGLNEIVGALEDVESHVKWVHRTDESRYLNKESYDRFTYYVSVNMPFPLKDRDVVLDFHRYQDSESKKVYINTTANKSLMAFKDEYIRITDYRSQYILEQIEDGWVTLDYTLRLDPAGKLPTWAVNLATVSGPVKTIESLYDLLHSGAYQKWKTQGLD